MLARISRKGNLFVLFVVKENGMKVPQKTKNSGEGNGNPLQYSCLEKSMDRGAWRATVHGVT